jgi:hypothetical protein
MCTIIWRATYGGDLDDDIIGMLELGPLDVFDLDLEGSLVIDGFHHCRGRHDDDDDDDDDGRIRVQLRFLIGDNFSSVIIDDFRIKSIIDKR